MQASVKVVPPSLRRHRTGAFCFSLPILSNHGVGLHEVCRDIFETYPVIAGRVPAHNYTASYWSCMLVDDAVALCTADPSIVAVQAPVSVSLRSSRRELHKVAAAHGVIRHREDSPSDLVETLVRHVCTVQCARYVFVFQVQTLHHRDIGGSAMPQSEAFPPVPLSPMQYATIVRDWCAATGSAMREGSCAVCARLTPLAELMHLSLDVVDLSPLDRPGERVTRAERADRNEPVVELPGPVLYAPAVTELGSERYGWFCRSCLNVLHSHKLPRHALANGRWVGSCPAVLQNLTYVEQLMIARFRHSFCVAQVSLGQRYLSANVIVFGQPVARAYDVLPPPRVELEQVFAILCLGPSRPTEDDFRRTPFLLRHRVFSRALEWLLVNSDCYESVGFSHSNLLQYPEDQPFVGVVYRHQETTQSGANTACYNSDPVTGSEKGQCAFIVHSVNGEELVNMPYEAKVAHAIRYFEDGGQALGFGHDSRPESIYHNPELYPGLFPWLYPFGKGGFGNSSIDTQLSHIGHVRANLLYHDRRFQTDRCFPFIVFNQRQIRSSAQGGYLLTQKGRFDEVAEKIVSLDRAALDSIIDRASVGEHVVPRTSAEKACFDLIGIVDRVAGHVAGSVTQKKYQRNEIRSLIYLKGAPFFFVTFAPADFKHPLCLYLCGESVDLESLSPRLRSSDDRLRAIAHNPVGAARFFNVMVNAFVQCVLQYGSGKAGLFGTTDAYYGTVEAQGRLTLHLHLLVWLKHGFSPQQIRDRILADPMFEASLVEWLESCHKGEFSMSTESELADELEEDYVDSRRADPCARTRLRSGVRDPATICPRPPPQGVDDEEKAMEWLSEVRRDADRVVFVSNRHDRNHGKGCWRGDPGYCRARFPRECRETTDIDRSSGAIRFKHLEPWINTYNPVLSYLLRCNSDVTCLLSGTTAKAVMAYVTDYVTKTKLTTASFFSTVRSIFDRNVEILLDAPAQRASAARSLVVKTVNAISLNGETGGPQVCASLLGHPDHYTSHTFRVFYWFPYCQFARADYAASRGHACGDDDTDGVKDRVMIGRTPSGIVQLNKIQDYTFRPEYFSEWCLYDYLRATAVHKLKLVRDSDDSDVFSGRDSVDEEHESCDLLDTEDVDEDEQTACHPQKLGRAYRFMALHPLKSTHGVQLLRERVVLNFVGGTLPRPDRGDREEYCFTMLVFFRPSGWRTGTDLLGDATTFTEAFQRTNFLPEHTQLMKNMNLLYECLDARDDYAAQRRAEGHTSGPLHVGGIDHAALDGLPTDVAGNDAGFLDHTEDTLASMLDSEETGKKTARVRNEMDLAQRTLGLSGSVHRKVLYGHVAGTLGAAVVNKSASYWKQLLQGERQRVVNQMSCLPGVNSSCAPQTTFPSLTYESGVVRPVSLGDFDNHCSLLPQPSRGPQDPHILELHNIIEEFTLNIEQTRAFQIVARHLHHHERQPLRMYLGGMAGTGKSRVLLALMTFLEKRSEAHRFIVLGPTGTSAALVGGSTYHSVLRINASHTKDGAAQTSSSILEKVRSRLELVDLIFIDEISMVSCTDLFVINSQLSKAFGDSSVSFGGKGVILAGDFAQLQPAGRSASLYSENVGLWSSSASRSAQNSAIGKALWHTFTTVIILRQNMRQRGISKKDAQFRHALENLRYARCTRDDIKLFRSRICRPSQGDCSHLRPEFRFVSIITARNAQRDMFNMEQSKLFSVDHNVPLFRFYSIDRWGRNKGNDSVRDAQRSFDKTVDPVRTSDIISPRLQTALWELPPSLTDHHAGILELCKGMPVLLKYNEATELCVTNGAEGVVYDWTCHKQDGHLVLDVLFVLLVCPPRDVQLEGLPRNVIPLGRSKKSVSCTLPVNDLTVSVQRDQVMVLPNFSMTDFAAQGRTRLYNSVHLWMCLNHQSLYTCLSRSSSLEGTLILDDFKESRMTRGASSALRREFRELEMLDDVTRLHYAGELPSFVSGSSRAELLSAYLRWKGARYVPPHVPSALDWSGAPEEELTLSVAGGPPSLNESSKGVVLPSKRKRSDERWTERKKRNQAAERDCSVYDMNSISAADASHQFGSQRYGFVWDNVDYSCGFDALLTVLLNVRADYGANWFSEIAPESQLMAMLSTGFAIADTDPQQLERTRDELRDVMHHVDSVAFPRRGTVGISLSELAHYVLLTPEPNGIATGVCPDCGAAVEHVPDLLTSSMWTVDPHWWDTVYRDHPVVLAQECALNLLGTAHTLSCGACGSPASVCATLLTPPKCIIIDSQSPRTVTPCESIVLPVNGTLRGWRLSAVIYYGFSHYTMRFVDQESRFWYHDGATTGRHCIPENGSYSSHWITTARSRTASHLVYTLID